MTGNRLYKFEKLCSKTAMELLFAKGKREMCYPIMTAWRLAPMLKGIDDPAARFVISVPKKRLRHAVDRVQMRRRIREAYRLSRHILAPIYEGENPQVPEIAFVFVANHLKDYASVKRAMEKHLNKIVENVKQQNAKEV